jgi:hypothetical protein
MCGFPRVRNNSDRKTQSNRAKAISRNSRSVGCKDEPGVNICEMNPEDGPCCSETAAWLSEDGSDDDDIAGHDWIREPALVNIGIGGIVVPTYRG